METVEDEEVGGSRSHPDYQFDVDHTNREELNSKETNAGIAFLQMLKQAFKDNEGVYSEFINVMGHFKERRVSVPSLVTKVEALLKDRHDLFMVFKAFLPKGYEVQKTQKKPADFDQALAFVRKIKAQDEDLYKRFLNILMDFSRGDRIPENVYSQFADLWKNHPDMMEEFVCFLPNVPSIRFTSQVSMKTQVELTHRGETKGELVGLKSSSEKCNYRNDQIHPHNSVKSNGRKHEKQADRVKSEHRQLVSAQKLAEGNGPAFIEQKEKFAKSFDESRMEQTHSHEQEKNAAVPIVNFLKTKLDFLRRVKSIVRQKEKYEEYLKCLEMLSDGITSHQDFNLQVVDMFPKSPELIAGSMDLVRQCETAELELLSSGKQGNWSHECRKRALADKGELEASIEQRKKSKRQPPSALEQDKEFHKPSLHNHNSPYTTDLRENHESKKIPLYSFPFTSSMEQNNSKTHPSKENPHNISFHATSSKSVEHDNSKRHPCKEDPQNKSSHAIGNNSKAHPSKENPHNISFHVTSSKSVEHDNSKRHPSKEDSRNLSSHAIGTKSVEQEHSKRHPSKENPHNKSSHATSSKSMEQENSKRYPFKENPHNKFSHAISSKYLDKPLSELDLSKCEQCTPSYRLLPDDYPLPTVGSRSAEGRAVLNDTWVSATSGSEDYSVKFMHKNEYEEVLLQCEDDRTDLDILLENASSTIRGLEGLLKVIRKRGKVIVEKYIRARQLRLIELLYSDCALEVLECLHQNAGSVTPVILKRIKQKQNEWLAYKAEMNKVWAAVFAKNYQKSLDRRSNGQEDMKKLNTKSLLAEIRSLNTTSRKSYNLAFSVAYGKSLPLVPDLTFKYQDDEVTEDVHKILQYSVKEVCSNAEHLTGIMHIWKVFLEPLFGKHSGLMEDNKLCEINPKDIRVSYSASEEGERTSRDESLPTAMAPTKGKAAESVHEGTVFHSNKEQKCVRPYDPIKNVSNIAFPVADCEQYIDDLNQLKYSEVEGKILPSRSADEKYSDSHVKRSITVPAEKSLDEVSTCYTAHRKLDNGHGYEKKEEASITMEVSNEIVAACLESENADDTRANPECEGDGLMLTSTISGPSESEKLLCRVLPLFTRETPANLGDSVIFYGNDNMYLLLRLYEALYDRIHAAKVHAASEGRSPESIKEGSSSVFYHKFLQGLYEFLDGTADSAKFEGDCRSLAGNECYLFLAIDKLICNLVKQLKAVASDEMAINLLALHTYEKLHAPGGIKDAAYHANACGLLHPENVYRFERRFETGQLFIQLMEGCFSEHALVNQMHPKFAKNFSNFMLSEARERLQKDHVFLKRNMRSTSEDNNQMNAFQNTTISNGLQLRICCNTYQVSYVFGTEDYFHRRKAKRSNVGLARVVVENSTTT